MTFVRPGRPPGLFILHTVGSWAKAGCSRISNLLHSFYITTYSDRAREFMAYSSSHRGLIGLQIVYYTTALISEVLHL